ncbi:HTH-type transcriptional regulator DmlR [Pantoea sp. Nvir]|uniref:LysR family transcriptional regulator n=1 Tax=Pantoea TaxID=53335 RepID=UPI000CDE1D43|nr:MULTISPECIES: LysR family transcriptional regulator [Pantoea]MCG7366717.1 LysR family transcriptional regulator [Pantoea sp. ACRSH]MCG7395892.1 LysR family transcriptional regulator [Pantoea sp. ACRSC]POW56043.1 transcriptional regulator [Pantoea alvi]UBN54579.1 LysR family transcriptional regulator [Pantoea agglomerans]
MDRLDCDRMFVAVLELGSFAAAAARLGVSSGQASKLVSRLERQLGVQLVKRSTRALSPTDVGRTYYEQVKTLLDAFDALDASVRESAGTPSGRLKISAPVTFGSAVLSHVLVAFARRYPLIELDVSFSDRPVSIVDEGFDIAVRIGNLSDSSLIARRLGEIAVRLAAAPRYLQQHGTPLHWRAIGDHQCITDTNFRDPWNWPFASEEGETVTVPVRGRVRFANTEACLQAAVAGLGIARLPDFIAAPALQRGDIVPVLADYDVPPLGLFALYPAARHLAQRTRLLVDFLADHFDRFPPGQFLPEWKE